jgi:hypothetical protein
MVKPVAAKAQAKPVATQPAARMKPVPPKAVLSHAPAGSQRIPTTAARQFGQAAAALAVPKAVAQKAMLSRQQPAPSKQAVAAVAAKKPVSQRHGFKTNEWIVYPAHGVGRIVGIEEQEIAGMSLELFVITFEKDKMTLRVPTGKSASVGMRKLAEDGVVKRAMDVAFGEDTNRSRDAHAQANFGMIRRTKLWLHLPTIKPTVLQAPCQSAGLPRSSSAHRRNSDSHADNGLFAGGKGATVAITTGCTDFCSDAFVEATVQLRKGHK